jgi:hypothetical protein
MGASRREKVMNQKRWDKLIQLTNSNFGIYELSLNENQEPEVFSFRSNTFLKITLHKGTHIFSMYYLEKNNWQYSTLEIKLYLQGYDLLNKKTTEYIPMTRKPNKKQHDYKNMCTQICTKCMLKYPKKEMINKDTCYICGEENKRSKAV